DEDKNGSLDATGGYGGAGIGGANLKNSGALEITGGTITATGTLSAVQALAVAAATATPR
ncbi:hypothetical protein ACSTB0_13610, partial [Faecalibacterium wellingii]|uniref:hypothetical protein n=1 Tax=Faecalibacterium wellingii TaxID=2929491 RepID=UPI003EDB395E